MALILAEVNMALQEKLQHAVRKVDTSGRLSLGRDKVGEQYDIHEAADGKITLTPVAVIPKSELWLHNNPDAKQAVLRGLADSAAGRTRDGGDFTKYLDEPDEE
jgi:hypothetical protein